jgi:hypothetical protein
MLLPDAAKHHSQLLLLRAILTSVLPFSPPGRIRRRLLIDPPAFSLLLLLQTSPSLLMHFWPVVPVHSLSRMQRNRLARFLLPLN